MTMTRQEIEEEVTALTAGRPAPAHARPSFIALLQYKNGLEIDQVCPYCDQMLRVGDLGSAWKVRCPCGRSDNAWRGF